MRILIVEDDPKMSLVLRDALEKRSYRIVPAQSGSDGLDIGLNHQFEAIILDAMLPKIDGGFDTKLIHTVRGFGYKLTAGQEQ